QDGEAVAKKPARKRTSRTTAPRAEPDEPGADITPLADEGVIVAPEPSAEPEPVGEPVSMPEPEPAAEPAVALEQAVEAPQPEMAEAFAEPASEQQPAEPPAEKKPKRTGWWRRGAGG
ncbi:MAG: hypothetical protein IMF05_07795, partial [Proteobacteria bacterium]|nr:hypothetical protein [Pseudomonadota bacterium]